MIYLNGNAIPHSVLALDQNLIEIDSDFEMKAQLIASNLGKVYKYVGETTLDFSNGAIYQIVEDEASTNDITWVLNAHVNVATDFNYDINFTSNNQSFSSLYCELNNLHYANAPDSDIQAYISNWTNEEYQRLTFDSVPSGELLQWLQANGHKIVNTYKFKRYVNLEGVSEMFGDTISIEEPALPNLYVQNSWQGEIVQIEGHVTDRIESAGVNNRIDIGGNNSIVNIEGASGVQINVNNGGSVVAENLTPDNIAQNVEILGVLGTHQGGGASGNTVTEIANSISIAQVSNLRFNSKNSMLYWDALNVDYIKELGFNTSVNYQLTVNGVKYTSTIAGMDLYGKLQNGSNTISVIANVTISFSSITKTGLETTTVEEYTVPAKVTLITLSTQFDDTPDLSAVEAVTINDKIYVSIGQFKTMYKFDPSDNSLTQLSITERKDKNNTWSHMLAVNNDLYFIGYYYMSNKYAFSIDVYDVSSDTLTRLYTDEGSYDMSIIFMQYNDCVLMNDKIIFLRPNDNDRKTYIYEFDLSNNTLTQLDVAFFQAIYGGRLAAIGTNIYFLQGSSSSNYFSSSDNAQIFDTISNTTTRLSISNSGRAKPGMFVYDDSIYLLGGMSNGTYNGTKYVYKFSTVTNTYVTWANGVVLPQEMYGMGVAIANKNIYIFGGRYPDRNNYYNITTILCIVNLIE